MTSEWISAYERLPDPDISYAGWSRPVVVLDAEGESATAQYRDGEWRTDIGDIRLRVEYWMPLPEFPWEVNDGK